MTCPLLDITHTSIMFNRHSLKSSLKFLAAHKLISGDV
jgi:hypothetical protein